MKMYFLGSCNHPELDLKLNTIEFRFRNGKSFELDRNETEWRFDSKGNLEMCWRGVYLWDYKDCAEIYIDEESDEGFIFMTALNECSEVIAHPEEDEDIPEDYTIEIASATSELYTLEWPRNFSKTESEN